MLRNAMNGESIETLVERRLMALQGKPTIDLLGLPKLEKEIVQINGKDVRIFTIHEVSKTGRHRFILQAIRSRWGGITAKVVALGFEISDDQSIRMLSSEELYDFT